MKKTLFRGARSAAMAAALLVPAAGCSLFGGGGGPAQGGGSDPGRENSTRSGGSSGPHNAAKAFQETLPPALPRDLSPDEARAQTTDSPAATFDVSGSAPVPVDLAKPPFGFIRLIARTPEGANPPALRVAEEGAQPQQYAPASKLKGSAGPGTRWEYFLINNPAKKAKAELVPR